MSTAGPAGAAAAPNAAAQAPAGPSPTNADGSPAGKAPVGDSRDGAAAAGQNGNPGIANQSIAEGGPAAVKPGAHAQNPPATVARQMPEWLGDKRFWQESTGTVDLKGLATAHKEATTRLSMRTEDLLKAHETDRRSRLPPKPENYQFRLSDNYVQAAAKHGAQIDPAKGVNVNDPMVRMLASVAHKNGLDQEQFQGMLDHYHFTKMSTRPDPQKVVMQLGENGKERLASVRMFLEGALGPQDTQELVSFVGGPTAKFVDMMERLMMRAGGGRMHLPPGAAGMPAGGPAPTKEGLKALMASEAYNNKRHPDYAKTQREVTTGWERLSGGAQVTTAALDRGQSFGRRAG